MIGNFENIDVKTGYPLKNIFKSGQIRSIFLTGQNFSFATETLFETFGRWIDDIQDEEIFAITEIRDCKSETEEQEYIKSELDYEYEGKPGKYKFTFNMVYNKEYHDNLKKWSGRDCRVFLSDNNNNIYANLNGTSVRGLDVEIFSVQKKQFGNGTEPGLTVVKLILAEADEYNLTTKMLWNPNSINLVFVNLTNISGAGNIIDFTIKDAVYGYLIQDLYVNEITVDDDSGILTVTSIAELGGGQYRITLSDIPTFGKIIIDSERHYIDGGWANYYLNETGCEFFNFEWETDHKFKVSVRYTGSGSAVTGLAKLDFSIVDDIVGVCTITGFTEISAGRYSFIVTESLTDGDISVDNGVISGTSPYSLLLEVVFSNWEKISTGSFKVVIKLKSTGAVMTGLTFGSFSISDDLNTTALLSNSFYEYGAGLYGFGCNNVLSTGNLIFAQGRYFGTGNYNFITACILNGGAADTTDWVDTDLDGVADKFLSIKLGDATATYEIITSTGFIGNAQKFTKNTGATWYWVALYKYIDYFKLGTQYKLRFKFNTLNAGTGSDRFFGLQLIQFAYPIYQEISIQENLEKSILPITQYESNVFTTLDTSIGIYCIITNFKTEMSVIIDELELIEV